MYFRYHEFTRWVHSGCPAYNKQKIQKEVVSMRFCCYQTFIIAVNNFGTNEFASCKTFALSNGGCC